MSAPSPESISNPINKPKTSKEIRRLVVLRNTGRRKQKISWQEGDCIFGCCKKLGV